jgi:hypothetical protein
MIASCGDIAPEGKLTCTSDMNRRFSEITRDEWATFYWANATGASDSEARFVRGEPRPGHQVKAAASEHDRLRRATDNERRRLPYDFWDATVM